MICHKKSCQFCFGARDVTTSQMLFDLRVFIAGKSGTVTTKPAQYFPSYQTDIAKTEATHFCDSQCINNKC